MTNYGNPSHRKFSYLTKLLTGIVLAFGIFFAHSQLIHAQGFTLPFADDIWTIFNAEWYSGYTVPGTSTPEDMQYHYSTPIFKYGGNQFISTIFWEYTEVLQLPQEISIVVNGEEQTILCEKKFNGIYYNNQRGRRVRPLDQKNLERLQDSPLASGYENMTVSGGIYTYCSKVNGSYTPGLFDVYGQVDHTLADTPQTFRLIIGVDYNFTGNRILSGTALAPTLQLSKNPVITGYMFDTNGGIAELDLSKHGQCKPGACNLKGEIGFFSRYNSNVITTSVETYYTNNRDISLHISATDPALFNVTGDFTSSPLTGLYDSAPVFDYIETGITLRYENKWNYISDNYVTIATMNSEEAKKCKYTDYLKRVFVDTISPTVPTIHPDVLPDCQNTSGTITRTGSVDTGAGLLHYSYEVYNNSGMLTGLALHGTTTGTSLTLDFSLLELGTYYFRLVAVDKVGNVSTGDIFTFAITTQFCDIQRGCNPSFQGEITFTPLNDTTIYMPSRGIYYANTTGVNLQLGATDPNIYAVSGDFLESPLTGSYTGDNIYTDLINTPIHLTNINQWNIFNSTYTVHQCTYKDAEKKVYVDTLAPTLPTIITPTTGSTVCASAALPVAWNAALDSGAGLAYYRYEVYNNSNMTMGLMLHRDLPKTTTGINLDVSRLPMGTYYMKILAVDNVGNISESTGIKFTLDTASCTSHGTGIQIVTPTIWLRNVELDTIYQSDPIRILGLTTSTLLQIDKGMLIINDEEVGTTGMVDSNDDITIELVSSDEYDETVTSTMTIAGLTGAFKLTTKDNDCSLSTAEKLMIENIYEEMRDEYDDNVSKYAEFLNTFQNMLEDESDLSDSCTLEYFLSLIDPNNNLIDTSDHITPNCKSYTISYNYDEQAYYAPQMVQKYYFVNRESLIRHLDYYNPGDCHINTYNTNERDPYDDDLMKHIAPNGKLYHFKQAGTKYYAQEFVTIKYFDSLSSIIAYIDTRNPAKEIWTHDIDSSFTPIVYAAPNGKEYKIYKTSRGYMSYKLMKVKYYDTLSALKAYINKNNPSKW